MQYYVTLYIGAKRQAMTFVVDSGSSWLWVPSVACSQCKKATAFNQTLSSTFNGTTKTQNVTYGIGSISGTESGDTVSLTSDGTANTTKARFLLVTTTKNLQDMVPDGIVGLTPSFSPGTSTSTTDTTGELFV
jgi:hypothetical protein